MKLQNKFKLGQYITSKQGSEFVWSYNDCNTFFIEFHDKMYGTDDLKRINGKYHDRRDAIKFQKSLVSPAQWLHMRDYVKIEAPYNWQDGDVAIVQHKYYASVFVYFDGAFWTVVEGQSLRGYDPKPIEEHMTNGWRKKNAETAPVVEEVEEEIIEEEIVEEELEQEESTEEEQED